MNSKIHIPEPCSVAWETMTPENDGRYCKACSKVVVDFTAMSNEEIKTYFISKPIEKTCGHFYKHQVSAAKLSSIEEKLLKLYQLSEIKIRQKAPRFIALMIIGFGLTLMGCRQKRYGGAPAWNHATVRYLDEPENRLTGDTVYYNSAPIDTLKRD